MILSGVGRHWGLWVEEYQCLESPEKEDMLIISNVATGSDLLLHCLDLDI